MSVRGPLHLSEPLDIDDARRASLAMARQRRTSEDLLEAQVRTAADAEVAYRKKFAQSFIDATGTAGEREAIAKRDSAKECRERDIAAGMVKVLTERLRGLEGERSQLKSLLEWSMRMNQVGVE